MDHVLTPAAVGAQQPPPSFGLAFDCIFNLHRASTTTKIGYLLLLPLTTAGGLAAFATLAGVLGQAVAVEPHDLAKAEDEEPPPNCEGPVAKAMFPGEAFELKEEAPPAKGSVPVAVPLEDTSSSEDKRVVEVISRTEPDSKYGPYQGHPGR